MDNYILNDNVLCFTEDIYDEGETVIIEKENIYRIKTDSLKFLKKCCKFYGHSYNLQRQFVIDNFNYYIKTPIILSEYKMIIFFPTNAPNSKKCIWISYNNVDRYVKEKDGTRIYFKGGQIINIDVSYTTIDNQITRCIKIEKFIRNIMQKKCLKIKEKGIKNSVFFFYFSLIYGIIIYV